MTSKLNSFKIIDYTININCVIPVNKLVDCATTQTSGIRHINLLAASGLHKITPKLHKEYIRILQHTDYSLFKNVLGEYTNCKTAPSYFSTLVDNLPSAIHYVKVNMLVNNIDILLKFLASEEQLDRLYKEVKYSNSNIKN